RGAVGTTILPARSIGTTVVMNGLYTITIISWYRCHHVSSRVNLVSRARRPQGLGPLSDPRMGIPGTLSSWCVAVLATRAQRSVKRDELLGLEDALFPLVQVASLRALHEAAD